ncbi:MAG: amino acid--tRNA ligase-related protein [Bryobacteraceae bacterium]
MWATFLSINPRACPKPANVRYLPQITQACTRLAAMVEEAMDRGQVPLALGGDHSVAFGTVAGADETLVVEDYDRPAMIDRYPTQVKAFYFEPDPDRPELALGVDVIAPEGYGEIIGGGQRIHNLDLLLRRLEEHHLPREAFEWYIDLRKYGTVPHSGFGMGVERFVAWMCGLEHIRETIAFPRMLYQTRP